MLLSERVTDGHKPSSLIIGRTFDINPYRAEARFLRDSTNGGRVAENRRLVGEVPTWLVWEWCKEAGVRWDDVRARKEVVKRKLQSGEASALRVWEGRY